MKVTSDLKISEVLSGKERATEVFMNQGKICITCGNIFFETVAHVAAKYRMDLNILLDELNKLPDASNA